MKIAPTADTVGHSWASFTIQIIGNHRTQPDEEAA